MILYGIANKIEKYHIRSNWISIYFLSNAIKNSDIIESRGNWNLIDIFKYKNNRGV